MSLLVDCRNFVPDGQSIVRESVTRDMRTGAIVGATCSTERQSISVGVQSECDGRLVHWGTLDGEPVWSMWDVPSWGPYRSEWIV